MRRTAFGATTLILSSVLYAQVQRAASPAFEVASVKPLGSFSPSRRSALDVTADFRASTTIDSQSRRRHSR